jgi:integrase
MVWRTRAHADGARDAQGQVASAARTFAGGTCARRDLRFFPTCRLNLEGYPALSDRAVALVVKRTAEAAGLDPARFAGHSLRSGFATSAARAGIGEADIMSETGHRSVAVVRRYIRRGSLFDNNAASRIGL